MIASLQIIAADNPNVKRLNSFVHGLPPKTPYISSHNKFAFETWEKLK